ncbi:MAG: 5-(carboxyamino)imidazole ribonucleotide synthase [Microcoleus vaginatus WJT46-NPBG5]|jgi:5-(carboxyamino)imidazole ribonucleotide synthase|nr:5-(carboxyamino)imidazole ribonucleotide synthase [Microcoleus vaginatus WJT46-NPBG5]
MVIERVGIIGGGQLAWMMAAAAEKLGVKLIIQTPNQSDPAVAIAADTILAPIDDAEATAQLASRCDVITFENEFVNLDALMPLAEKGVCFRPSLQVLAPLLDKYHQRSYMRDLGLPVPRFFALEEKSSAQAPAPQIKPSDFPLVMKARRHGYDGQGTAIIQSQSELEATWEQWKYVPVMLEEFVPFERELAVIAARSLAGEIAIYPIVETQQENQVCRRVIVPANLEPKTIIDIEEIARTLLESLQAVGIFGIELFLTAGNQVLINEIAPRTHNSGHFSLDAGETSQFEQHLRAVCNLPLGNPNLSCAGAVMVNLLGYEHSQNSYLDKRQKLAEIPQAHVHWYGKTESRPGRKLGHVTVLQNSPSAHLRQESLKLAQICDSIWYG